MSLAEMVECFQKEEEKWHLETLWKRCCFAVVTLTLHRFAYLHLVPVWEHKKTQLRRQSTLLSCKQEIVESSVCFIIMLNYCAYLVSKGGSRAWFFNQEIEVDKNTIHGNFCSWVMTSYCFLHKLLVQFYSMKHSVWVWFKGIKFIS